MLHDLFLYQDEIHIVYDDDMITCITTDNTNMHSDIVKVHKGVDNTIRFRVRDRDRKPQSIAHKEVRARIVNTKNQEVVLERYLTHLNEKGLIELRMLESDLVDIAQGFYKLIITGGEEMTHGVSGQIIQTPFYADEDNNTTLDIEITGQAQAEPRPTYTITEWTPWYAAEELETFYSSAIPAGRLHNYTSSTHTVAFHVTNFTGKVQLHASLEDVPSNNLNGFFQINMSPTQKELVFDNHTGIVPLVFQANYMWLKIVYMTETLNSGTLNKVEIRN